MFLKTLQTSENDFCRLSHRIGKRLFSMNHAFRRPYRVHSLAILLNNSNTYEIGTVRNCDETILAGRLYGEKSLLVMENKNKNKIQDSSILIVKSIDVFTRFFCKRYSCNA